MANDPFTRRNFIKTTATTTLGVTLASTTLAFNQDENKKPVRVAVIGTGNRGTALLRNLLAMEGVEISALCDLNTDRLAYARKTCVEAGQKEPEVYSKDEYSYKELMDRENLDAVIIATYTVQIRTRMLEISVSSSFALICSTSYNYYLGLGKYRCINYTSNINECRDELASF